MKALIITGKYAQDIEVYYPLYRMQEEGWDVDIAVLGDKEALGVYGMRLTPTVNMPTFALQGKYGLVILPGGARAMEYLRTYTHDGSSIPDLLKWFHTWGGVIGSICHGTQLLISAGLVKGRKVSGYYSIKDDIINAGGEFVDAPFVTDGKIVCSPHYKFLGPWMKEVIAQAYYYHDAKSV